MTVFINGKQKRVPRPQLIDGLPVEDLIATSTGQARLAFEVRAASVRWELEALCRDLPRRSRTTRHVCISRPKRQPQDRHRQGHDKRSRDVPGRGFRLEREAQLLARDFFGEPVSS